MAPLKRRSATLQKPSKSAEVVFGDVGKKLANHEVLNRGLLAFRLTGAGAGDYIVGRRMLFDPEKEADQIAELDRKRMELIKRSMPRYAEIARQALAEVASERQEIKPKVTVEIKAPK